MQENEEIVEAQETNDTDSTVTQEPVSQPQKPDPQQSFAQLRERTKKVEQENQELARQLEQARAVQKREIADDDVVMGADVKELKQQIKRLTADQMLAQKYPDINQVVNAQNIALLKEKFPAMAEALSYNQDYYSQAAAVYEAITNMGINKDAYSKEKELVATNSSKPRPLASLKAQDSGNPLDRANAFQNGLTPELKDQLLKEMNDAIRQGY